MTCSVAVVLARMAWRGLVFFGQEVDIINDIAERGWKAS